MGRSRSGRPLSRRRSEDGGSKTVGVDTISRVRRSQVMSRIGPRDTGPELIVRRIVSRLGYKIKLHSPELPGRPDVVVPGRRAVIFVHGCFWHGCARCDRGIRVPKTNTGFWTTKVKENRARDRRVTRRLRAAGWRVVTVWGCQTGNEARLRDLLSVQLAGRKRA